MEVSEKYLQLLEDRLKPGSRSLITSAWELEQTTQHMLKYREYLFTALSTMTAPDSKTVLNELAKLFRIEAICVALQLRPFESALKNITVMVMATLVISFFTFVTVFTYTITHW